MSSIGYAVLYNAAKSGSCPLKCDVVQKKQKLTTNRANILRPGGGETTTAAEHAEKHIIRLSRVPGCIVF